MAIELPPLPYHLSDLEPHMSAETLDFHYHKHNGAYASKLNALIKDTDWDGMDLESIVKNSDGAIFNNAAQIWNHNLFWQCLSKNGGGDPQGSLLKMIERDFSSVEQFREKFTDVALKTFGSGWAWLILTPENTLEIQSTSNALTPLCSVNKPLLGCDVWEHAYYIDYRNNRAQYLKAFWNIINWQFIQEGIN